jgi:hypothetical protein
MTCTTEYDPVCGEVDTGIVCVKAPCPSAREMTFGNACEACAEPRSNGYYPGPC